MNRRAVIALTVVLALIGARLLVTHGMHRVNAARSGSELRSGSEHASSGSSEAASNAAANEARLPATGPENRSTDSSASAATTTTKTVSEPAPPAAQDGVTDVDPHKAFGSKSAPIVMEVFSDYQCPSCKGFFESTNRQLMENYVTTGKVYLIHRDFPLAMHAYSRIAARYARAAAELGKIEPVEKVLYDNQEKWEQTGDVDGTVAGVLSPAEMNKVRTLVKGTTLDPLIEKDMALGTMYRINQTPTTVFHSRGQTYPYAGSMTYDILRTFLDQLLSQK